MGEASSTFVLHPDYGPLCYLCDLISTAGGYKLVPRDAYRQRVYLEPIGLYLQADSGIFASIALNLEKRRIEIVFAASSATPAGEQTYETVRLRADKCSVPSAKRPGSNFT